MQLFSLFPIPEAASECDIKEMADKLRNSTQPIDPQDASRVADMLEEMQLRIVEAKSGVVCVYCGEKC